MLLNGTIPIKKSAFAINKCNGTSAIRRRSVLRESKVWRASIFPTVLVMYWFQYKSALQRSTRRRQPICHRVITHARRTLHLSRTLRTARHEVRLRPRQIAGWRVGRWIRCSRASRTAHRHLLGTTIGNLLRPWRFHRFFDAGHFTGRWAGRIFARRLGRTRGTIRRDFLRIAVWRC